MTWPLQNITETAYANRTSALRAPSLPAKASLRRQGLASVLGVMLCLGSSAVTIWAQDKPADAPETPTAPMPRDTFFEHSDTAKWWVSGQANFVFQAHGDFYAAYSGPNSFKNTSETRDLACADALYRL